MPATHRKLRQGAESRERLMRAAIELVAQGGYAGTGVDAIAARAGVVKSALYWHFGSKEGLLAAALERTSMAWVETTEGAVVADPDPVARLDQLIDRVHGVYTESPEGMHLILSTLIERAQGNPEVRDTVANILGAMRSAIQRGMSDVPGVSPEHIEGIARFLLQCLMGAFLDHVADNDAKRLERSLTVIRKAVILLFASEIQDSTEA